MMLPDERDWLSGTSPRTLVEILRKVHSKPDRPLLHFALGCCRFVWPALVDERSRRAVEVLELFLVGLAPQNQLDEARQEANAARDEARIALQTHGGAPATTRDYPGRALHLSRSLGAHLAHTVADIGYYDGLIAHARDALAFRRSIQAPPDVANFKAALCRILREVAGNPCRPVSFQPEWRTDTAVALARGMYAASDFSALPILADALQDAGCENEALLYHCRAPTHHHARGCWVVDSVLRGE